ncbi:MAG: elongation factor P [Alphaproteobacteria bacterium]|nr:elongation factor P [Alphaproteobacteria bacterium]
MKVGANSIRPGNLIEHNGKQWAVLKSQIITPGKGGAFVQVEMRDIKSGNKSNERFRTADTVERLSVEERPCTFLFGDDDNLTMMDIETFEQFVVSRELAGDPARFLQDGMEVTVDLVEGKPVSIELPDTAIFTIKETEPVVKGQTASGSYKPAILDNGLRTAVPPHINVGERVVISTVDGSYLERAKG